MTTNKEWLASLKPGDEVAVHGGFHPVIMKVTRLTPTQIVVGGSRYRKETGVSIGSGLTSIGEVTDEIKQRIRLRQVRSFLAHVNWQQLDADVAFRVRDLIIAAAAAKDEREGEV